MNVWDIIWPAVLSASVIAGLISGGFSLYNTKKNN